MTRRGAYLTQPYISVDNHVSGYNVLQLLGETDEKEFLCVVVISAILMPQTIFPSFESGGNFKLAILFNQFKEQKSLLLIAFNKYSSMWCHEKLRLFGGIEMNEARKFYLKTYSIVDKNDLLPKGWGVLYVTWFWGHWPIYNCKAIELMMSYDIYKRYSLGSVVEEWSIIIQWMTKKHPT